MEKILYTVIFLVSFISDLFAIELIGDIKNGYRI